MRSELFNFCSFKHDRVTELQEMKRLRLECSRCFSQTTSDVKLAFLTGNGESSGKQK
jgi:hypothetical protein